jgi:hypothetical protein
VPQFLVSGGRILVPRWFNTASADGKYSGVAFSEFGWSADAPAR